MALVLAPSPVALELERPRSARLRHTGGDAGSIGTGLLSGGICSLIAWIGGLIKTAQISAWVWFVLILLFTPLATLIYGIVGPDKPQAQAAY